MDESIDAGVEEEVGTDLEETVVDEQVPSDGDEQDDTDWEAIAKTEHDRAENYKKAFTQKRMFVKAGATAPLIEEEDDEDRPVTLKDLKALQQSTMAVVSESKEDTLLTQKITDPKKRAFVKQLLESRIVRTGTSDEALSSDIDAALAIADSQKKDKTISELKRAAANKPNTPSAGSSSEKPLDTKPYKIDAALATELEKRAKTLGVDPEKFKADFFKNSKSTKTLG